MTRARLVTAALVVLLAAIAAARVVSTYGVFSETADEHHFVAGLEWWDRGAYTYTIYHPPLARIASALPLYLSGARSHGLPDIVAEKNAILYSGKGYVHNLALARLGILPFLLIAIGLVWWWTRHLFGDAAGVCAVLLFSTLPPVLAHSGLTTTDAPLMATLTLALLAFVLWLERPSLPRGILLGLAGGLAVLSKFSALPFFLASAVAIVAVRLLLPPRTAPAGPPVSAGRRVGSLALAALLAAAAVWAGYRFSWGSFPASPPASAREVLHGAIAGRPSVPAPEFFAGLRNIRQQLRLGHPGYLFGRYSHSGWWYYFPVALFFKTPLPFLLLAAAGAIGGASSAVRRSDWRPTAPLIAAAAILATSLTSHIDIGVRHVLPIYPLMAITAGLGAAWMWRAPGRFRLGRVAVVALVAWQLIGSLRDHPDYLASFNELAGSHPDRILLDSNLDWGQDLYRLSKELRRRGVDSVALAYFGNADLSRHGLPPIRPLPPDHPTTGWIAISEMWLKDVGGEGKAYRWLRGREPVARVGRSILLYYLPSPPSSGSAGAPQNPAS